MKLEAKLTNMAYDYAQKGTKFEFFCYGDELANLEKYLGKKINLEFKGEKRSNNANGYLWALLGELQEKLRIPKEDLYRHYVSGCGVYDVIPVKDVALQRFLETWRSNGLGWITETMKSKIKDYTNVVAYYGTSAYTKEEMSVLLSQVVEDCIDQGIPVKREEDIKALLEAYDDKS